MSYPGYPPYYATPFPGPYLQNPNTLPFTMADPIGSIVGLRVVQLDHGLGYIPVEPHINYLINQQFGRAAAIYPVNNIQSLGRPADRQDNGHQNTTTTSTPLSMPPIDPGPHRDPPRAQSLDPPRRQQIKNNNEMEDDWFKPTPQPKSGVRRSAHWRNDPEDYDPWGRGGAGAPLRDASGKVIAVRGRLRAASLANVNISDPHQVQPQRHAMDQPLSSQDVHKMELMKQIEDNKRRREMERQKELDIERKEMRRLEEYNARIRREEEEERKREKDRALAMERRAAAIAQEQQNRTRQVQQRPSPPQQPNPPRGRRASLVAPRDEEREDEQPQRAEWWERKPNYEDSRKSAAIPTMRNGVNTRPETRGRHSYSPAESVRQHQSRDQGREPVEGSRAPSARPRRSSIPPRAPHPDDERPIKPAKQSYGDEAYA